MDLELLQEKEAPLLSRRRVSFMAEFSGATPSRNVFVDAISKKLKVKKELIIIRHIFGRFGSQRCKVIAHIYKSADDINKTEGKYIIKKHKVEEKPSENAKSPEKQEDAKKTEE